MAKILISSSFLFTQVAIISGLSSDYVQYDLSVLLRGTRLFQTDGHWTPIANSCIVKVAIL